jgi:hypothetical protein
VDKKKKKKIETRGHIKTKLRLIRIAFSWLLFLISLQSIDLTLQFSVITVFENNKNTNFPDHEAVMTEVKMYLPRGTQTFFPLSLNFSGLCSLKIVSKDGN